MSSEINKIAENFLREHQMRCLPGFGGRRVKLPVGFAGGISCSGQRYRLNSSRARTFDQPD